MRTQIVSRAIIKKENERINDTYHLEKNNDYKVLGCYILNPQIEYSLSKNFKVILDIEYEINLWLLNKEENKTECFITDYKHNMSKYFEIEDSLGNETLSAQFLEKPNCINVTYVEDNINIDITYMICIELIGDRKFYIEVANDEIDENVDNKVVTDYLNKG